MLEINRERRKKYHKANKRVLLRFLRTEIWSNAEVLAKVLRKSPTGIYKILNTFESHGIIESHFVPEHQMKIWGITNLGQIDAWMPGERLDRPYFEKSKINPITMLHSIYLQSSHLQAIEAGWKNWIKIKTTPKGLKNRPDALCINPLGQKIAIELERTIKTQKRYKQIISAHLQAITDKHYYAVHYICPDRLIARRLQIMFHCTKSVKVDSTTVRLQQKHRSRLLIYTLDSWPFDPCDDSFLLQKATAK